MNSILGAQDWNILLSVLLELGQGLECVLCFRCEYDAVSRLEFEVRRMTYTWDWQPESTGRGAVVKAAVEEGLQVRAAGDEHDIKPNLMELGANTGPHSASSINDISGTRQ